MNTSEQSFHNLGLAPDMRTILEKNKFIIPTPIQLKSIPIALEGKDVVGIAQTGTGKTLAFGIPTVQRLAADGGRALALVPTRELAVQVADALQTILKPFKMSSTVLIGGMPIRPQIAALRRNPDIIVATPGRMIDHIYQGTVDFSDLKVLILDEADRMFDMGFAPQVEKIISCLPPKRQTLLFSATMPPDIVKLATKHMELPIQIEIAPPGTTIEGISQELFIVKEPHKEKVLKILLKEYRGTVLIFTRTKSKASRVTRMVRAMGERAAEIHSDRSMSQRESALQGFKRGKHRVMVATDIASRGIDVSMIELVINYDLPDDIENYVHRIGRTGRAGRKGHAVTMATPQQSIEINKIERLIKKSLPRTKHPEYTDVKFTPGYQAPARFGRKPGGRRSGPGRPSAGRPSSGRTGSAKPKTSRPSSKKSGSSTQSTSNSKPFYKKVKRSSRPAKRH